MLKKVWMGVLYLLIRAAVSLRYRLRVYGLENLSAREGVLFLPNHPAEIDPVILTLILWKRYQAHPLVAENFYYLKGVHFLLKLVGAVPIPDLNGTINSWKEWRVEQCFQRVAKGLRKGSDFLIYPAGKLKLGAEESIGGASFVHRLVQECPDVNMVLVRTTGLWGSRFSRALTGLTPDFGTVLWEGIKVVLKNLIFFTPRREVTVEFEPASDRIPRGASRLEFNQALEWWYNERGSEPLTLVSDHFWNECYPKVTASEQNYRAEALPIPPEIEKEIRTKIADLAKRETVQESDHLARDLGLDSLDLAQLQTFLIERYETPSLDPLKVQTVGDMFRAAAYPTPGVAPAVQKKKGGWLKEGFREGARPNPLPPEGSTIQEAFLKVCDRLGPYTACGDERVGSISYRKLKLMVLTLADHFRQFEGKHIGVLFPASTISYAIVIALLLAGKVPVMLNWTVGVRALNHCKEAAGLNSILSSRLFLDRLTDGDLGHLYDELILMEDLKSAISIWSRLKGFLGLFKKTETLLQELELKSVAWADPAVILFTSGTETLPKGVPLSHGNLLENHRAGLSCIQVAASDILYGVLPPFHSFGFSVTGILPLLAGLKVFYAPDPTQYFAMAHDIEERKITILCSAPTFIKGLFEAAKPGQLRSLRFAVSGAEKTPELLFQSMEKMGKEMLEGYGITECGPVVTLTRPKQPREGVGQPLPGIELSIIDPGTLEKLPEGMDGEICIHGPSVFQGYLGEVPSPFIDFDGKRWYRSGDRGHLAPSGALILSGRLKRFIKIAGEMVSLAGIEKDLLRLADQNRWAAARKNPGPPLAVAVAERNSDSPLIIVFATFEISKEMMNDALRAEGLGRIIKVAEVRLIEQIPLTGTGKIHYRALEEMIAR